VIFQNSVKVKYWSCGEQEEIACIRLMPIPLTPEILEKAGFKFDGDFNSYSISSVILSKNYCLCSIGDEYLCELNRIGKPIKHIHQLQNLYFALTGEELQIIL
jgi:hypothetical protein